VKGTLILIFAVLASQLGVGQDKAEVAVVYDPFPTIDCPADTFHTDHRISPDCKTFVQLVRIQETQLGNADGTKDQSLVPMTFGPLYACFGIDDELFIVDSTIDGAKEDKLWQVAHPRFIFYKSGIKSGLDLATQMVILTDGKWDRVLPEHPRFTANSTEDDKKRLGIAQLVEISVSPDQIAIGHELTIQSATGRFTYTTKGFNDQPGQLAGQCAVFKQGRRLERNTLHMFWTQIN
jgi:hypothetical protein